MHIQRLEILTRFPRRASHSCAKSDSGSLRSFGRLLHLEAGEKNIRTGEQGGVGSCM